MHVIRFVGHRDCMVIDGTVHLPYLELLCNVSFNGALQLLLPDLNQVYATSSKMCTLHMTGM